MTRSTSTQGSPPALPAVILAAGQGHRLLESSGSFPKPLTPLLGVSLLERTVLSCRDAGITEGYVIVGYRREFLLPAIAEVARRCAVRARAVFPDLVCSCV
jgi:choline kinase